MNDADLPNTNENVTENKIINKYKYYIGVIFIGAIGSGFWDLILKDLLFKIGNYFVNTISFFHEGYIDTLYKNVGSGGSGFDYLPSMLLILVIISLPIHLSFIIWIYKTKSIKFRDAEQNTRSIFNVVLLKNHKLSILIIVILFTPMSILYTNLLIKGISTIGAVNSISRSIEIIHPYISEKDFLILRSKFRQIDNKDKVVEIMKSIKETAKKNNIKLDEYNLYGIEN